MRRAKNGETKARLQREIASPQLGQLETVIITSKSRLTHSEGESLRGIKNHSKHFFSGGADVVVIQDSAVPSQT